MNLEKLTEQEGTAPQDFSSSLPDTGGSVLVFVSGGQRYGLEVSHVVQIIEMVAFARLPSAPPVIAGVIDFRGQVIPLVDMRVRLRIPVQPYGLRTPIVVSWLNGRMMGLVVDAVRGVEHLQPAQIDVPNKIFTDQMRLQTHHLVGVARLPDGLLLILDPSSFLSLEEQEALSEILSS